MCKRDVHRLFYDVEETGGWHLNFAHASDERCAHYAELWEATRGNKDTQRFVPKSLRMERGVEPPMFCVPNPLENLGQTSSEASAAHDQTVNQDTNEREETEATELEEKEKKKKHAAKKKAQRKRIWQRKREQAAILQTNVQELSRKTSKSSGEDINR